MNGRSMNIARVHGPELSREPSGRMICDYHEIAQHYADDNEGLIRIQEDDEEAAWETET